MQAVAQLYDPGNSQTLQEFIIYFGIVELMLSQLPDIHTLRFVNVIATFCTVGFTLIATALSVHDGESCGCSRDRSRINPCRMSVHLTFSWWDGHTCMHLLRTERMLANYSFRQ